MEGNVDINGIPLKQFLDVRQKIKQEVPDEGEEYNQINNEEESYFERQFKQEMIEGKDKYFYQIFNKIPFSWYFLIIFLEK